MRCFCGGSKAQRGDGRVVNRSGQRVTVAPFGNGQRTVPETSPGSIEGKPVTVEGKTVTWNDKHVAKLEPSWDIPSETPLHEKLAVKSCPRPALPRPPASPDIDAGAASPPDRSPSGSPSCAASPSCAGTRSVATQRTPASELIPRLQELCRAGRTLDAFQLLKEHEAKSKQAVSSQVSAWSTFTQADAIEALEGDEPLVAQLRMVGERLHSSMGRTIDCATRQDVHWAQMQIKDPKIGKDFNLEMKLRFAQDLERQATGPKTQIVVSAECSGFPLRLTDFVALQCEADLFRKEWMKDCVSFEGKHGLPSELVPAFVHVQLSPALMPFKLEELVLREFAVCPDGPPFESESCSSSGVLISENGPPDGVSEFQGFAIPPTRGRIVRLTGEPKMLFATRSKLGRGCTDLYSAVRIGLPVPEWMVPLDLLKRFAADIFRESLRRLKEHVIDNWDNLGYKARVASREDFYHQVVSIEDAGAEVPRKLSGAPS